MSRLEVRGLAFRHPGSSGYLYRDLSFTLGPGEALSLCGPNGSGKTTLLQTLCGIIPQIFPGRLTGSVLLDGDPVAGTPLNRLGQKINLLMQDPELQLFFPEVEQELAFALENAGLPREEILARIDALLNRFGISHLRHAGTAKLSFGERKLVVFASLLAIEPDIFLLDEPFAGLAPKPRLLVTEVLRERLRCGCSLIIADHEPSELATAVFYLPGGDI